MGMSMNIADDIVVHKVTKSGIGEFINYSEINALCILFVCQ